MRNISDKVVEKIETHFMFNIFFFAENRAVYGICGKVCYSQKNQYDNTIRLRRDAIYMRDN
jgi:hypothetical protein